MTVYVITFVLLSVIHILEPGNFLEVQLSYKDSSYIYAVTAVSTASLTF